MITRKSIFCIMVLALMATTALAQSAKRLKLSSGLVHTHSLEAATCPKDNNGKACAQVFIELPLHGVMVEGDAIMGEVQAVTGGYELYVVSGTKKKKLTIRHNDFYSLDIPLATAEGDKLVGNESYRVVVEVPVDENAGKTWLTLASKNVKNCIVLINGQELKTDANGKIELNLPHGDYSYEVRADRYHPYKGMVSLKGKPVVEEFSMSSVMGTLTVITQNEAKVFVDNVQQSDKVISVPTGPHKVKTLLLGYTIEKTVNVPSEGTSVDMNMLGTLRVTHPRNGRGTITPLTNQGYALSGAKAKKGNVGFAYNTKNTVQGLLGKYNVDVHKSEFYGASKTIEVKPLENATTSFSLVRIVDPYFFLNYLGTPNAPIGFMTGWVEHFGFYFATKASVTYYGLGGPHEVWHAYHDDGLKYPLFQDGTPVDFSQFEKKCRNQWDVTVGGMARLFSCLYLFAGGGYGVGEDFYMDGKTLFTNHKKNGRGPVAEGGVMLKFGGWNIIGGYNMRFFDGQSEGEPMFGVGYSWNLDD